MIGVAIATSKKRSQTLAKEIGINPESHLFIAFGKLTTKERAIAEKLPVLATQPKPNNSRQAGAKTKGLRVSLQVRLSDKAIALLNQQPNKAGFVAELIEQTAKKTRSAQVDGTKSLGADNNRDRTKS